MTTYDLGVSRRDVTTASFLKPLSVCKRTTSLGLLISSSFVVILLLPLSCHLETLLSVDSAQGLGLQQLCWCGKGGAGASGHKALCW